MAIMLPEMPRECTESSLETLMFEGLKKLSDEYYVFHSFKIVNVEFDGLLRESETDFVIFNPDKGILCLEAKAGHVRYQDGEWYYASGKKMAHGGPYLQATNNKWKLVNYFRDNSMNDIVENCKFLHGVWFPSISRAELNEFQLPADADASITLTNEAIDDPEKYISKIFALEQKKGLKTNLANYQIKRILNTVLCPQFHLVPSMKNQMEHKRKVFNRMIKEQVKILDYLEDQPVAVINGVAGSGKTMIAIEKARRCAEKGERVLFLCYNRYLCDYLKDNCKNDNIDFYTLDALACKICKTSVADINALTEKIWELSSNDQFPYKHIIIDEGQDFGQENIEEANLIEVLEMIVLDDSIEGSFYLFYDKMQLIQGRSLPSYISDADCRLSLYKNCRNTENIAITSMRPFPDKKKPRLFDAAIKGESTKYYSISSDEDGFVKVNELLDKCIANKIDNVVILTCKTEEKSWLSSRASKGIYNYRRRDYKFSTCRKFKGLEADVVILIDIDYKTLSTNEINIFYVGASRARFALNLLSGLNDEECNLILEKYDKANKKRPQKAMASFLNATYIK